MYCPVIKASDHHIKPIKVLLIHLDFPAISKCHSRGMMYPRPLHRVLLCKDYSTQLHRQKEVAIKTNFFFLVEEDGNCLFWGVLSRRLLEACSQMITVDPRCFCVLRI